MAERRGGGAPLAYELSFQLVIEFSACIPRRLRFIANSSETRFLSGSWTPAIGLRAERLLSSIVYLRCHFSPDA